MKANKKERFFEVSLQLIHEKGFKATTMRNIADALDFKVANVYNYIDNKQSLLEIFLFDISAEFHHRIDHIIASSYTPKEKLRALISYHVQLPAEKPYHIGLLVNEWRNLKGEKLEQFLAERNAYEQKVQSIIKEGIDAGELRKMNLEVATFSILSSVRWLFSWYTSSETTINPIELEKQLVDFIFEGIRYKV